METSINVQPLPQKKRHRTFIFLVCVFLISLPFLYMYAMGYRFDEQKPTTIVSTGGLYVGVARLEAEIYIDDELVRETRAFRKAFYAQGLNAGTHRVHVQKEGYHTWVKELPVAKHLVTEAEAFNLPLVPTVRVISAWQSATGTMVVREVPAHASTTNELLATTTKKTNHFTPSEEYHVRMQSFATTTPVNTRAQALGSVATTTDSATTTVIFDGVKLYENGDDVYAAWVGSFEQMPYYYCAEDFPRYESGKSGTSSVEALIPEIEEDPTDETVIHPVQTVREDEACDPVIRMDRRGETVHDFDFFPGSTDLVIMVLDSGVYAVEIDDRGWQNAQPLFLGQNLRMSIEDGVIYLFDGTLIYQLVVSLE